MSRGGFFLSSRSAWSLTFSKTQIHVKSHTFTLEVIKLYSLLHIRNPFIFVNSSEYAISWPNLGAITNKLSFYVLGVCVRYKCLKLNYFSYKKNFNVFIT